MSDEMNPRIKQTRASLETRATKDLLEIWHRHDADEWTDEAFQAVHDILSDRLGSVPEPDPSQVSASKQDAKDESTWPDFLHDPDRVFSLSYWARILAWAMLILYVGTTAWNLVNSWPGYQAFAQPSRLLSLVPALLPIVLGVAYFVILQAVSQGLLLLMDIALDMSDARTDEAG